VVVAALVAAAPTHRLADVLAVVAGALIVAGATLRPLPAMAAVIVFIPLQPGGLPALYGLGVPEVVLRAASGFLVATVAGLALAAGRELLSGRARLDLLDWVVLAYLAVVTFELVMPHVLVDHPVGSLAARLDAWRGDATYPLLLVAARRAPLPPGARRRLVRVFTVTAAVVMAVGFYERLDPSGFVRIVVSDLKLPRYDSRVLHESPSEIASGIANFASVHPFRISSTLLYPFDLGDYMLVALAVWLEALLRARGRPGLWVGVVGALATLYLTEVRGDLLAGAAVAAFGLVPLPGRLPQARRRLAVVLVLAVVAAAPFLGASRYLGGHGAARSTNLHEHELANAVSFFVHHLSGLGLGNQPGASARFGSLGGNAMVGDNSVLQVGIELGVQGLLPWLALLALTAREVIRRAVGDGRAGGDGLAVGAGVGLAAVLIAGQTHPAFVSFPAAWTVMLLLGTALRPAPEAPGDAGRPPAQPAPASTSR
jgi:hypothetical protein